MRILDAIHSPKDLRGKSDAELKALAEEIRELIVGTVAANGGHLSSNLGTVELTIALNLAFDAARDKILFDVGHQSYAHKILNGRAASFSTLRQKGGLSGFPRPEENPVDGFVSGHAATAISAALGLARARDLMGDDYSVVAVVGDGALTGGMCYEALNDAGQKRTPLIVLLNDNDMSIARNVGAMSRHLTNLRQSTPYRSVKRTIRGGLEGMPGGAGKSVYRALGKIRDALKTFFVDDRFFEALGFEYEGPIDGHDIRGLEKVLLRARDARGPVLVHVVTQKGRGYAPAEINPQKFHGTGPFDAASGESAAQAGPSNGRVMAGELIAMAENDIRVVAVTAAMPDGTGLSQFAERFPGRLFDVGIAEEHAVTMAAGLAAGGMRPYVAIYSSFLQRAYDQILTDVCLPGLPVTFLIDRAGLVGADGATHQGAYDLCYLRQMPGMIVSSPRDLRDLKRLLRLSASCPGPFAIRYAKEADDLGPHLEEKEELRIGQWEELAAGRNVCILAVGRMVQLALAAAIELNGKKISCGVIDARFIKPLDEKLLRKAAEAYPLLVTLEDGSVMGGFAEAVAARVADWDSFAVRPRLLALGLPDRFIEHGSVEEQMDALGLNAAGVAARILKSLS